MLSRRPKGSTASGAAIVSSPYGVEILAPELLERLIQQAEAAQASDIHLQMQNRGAAVAFRLDGVLAPVSELPGEIAARAKLSQDDDNLRLVEDLAIDSLTMLEIVFMAEDVLQVSIDNEELRPFRTLGDIKRFLAWKRLGGGRRRAGASVGGVG